MGFSRLGCFDVAAAILVCKSELNLGRVCKLPRGAGPRWRQQHRSVPVSRIPQKNRGTVNSLETNLKIIQFSSDVHYFSSDPASICKTSKHWHHQMIVFSPPSTSLLPATQPSSYPSYNRLVPIPSPFLG